MRVVDTVEYISALRELTEAGKEVSLRIVGNSMAPFLIHDRDLICFRKPEAPLRVGDMVFYQRRTGQFVMHRICRVSPEGYGILGDAQVDVEERVQREQIFAIVTRVNRKGTWIGPKNLWWRFFAGPWLWVIPWRPFLIGLYRRWRRWAARLRKDQT